MSEALQFSGEGSEALTAKRMMERPAKNNKQLMEEVCERENCWRAFKRVKSNKGSAGIDGMTVEQLPDYLKEHCSDSRTTAEWVQAAAGEAGRDTQTGRRDATAGHPDGAGPNVQQAVMQVLQGRWDAEFSEHSYGFRAGRSGHEAVARRSSA